MKKLNSKKNFILVFKNVNRICFMHKLLGILQLNKKSSLSSLIIIVIKDILL